jgi:hypothetical protein
VTLTCSPQRSVQIRVRDNSKLDQEHVVERVEKVNDCVCLKIEGRSCFFFRQRYLPFPEGLQEINTDVVDSWLADDEDF